MITGSGYISKTLQSLYYFLRNTTYNKSGVNHTLLTAFDGLDVLQNYPDSLEKLPLPTVAVMMNPVGAQGVTVNSGTKLIPLSFSVYGFCGGKQTDGDNQALRDELCNDVREILEDTDYINLYNYPDFNTVDGDMSIESVESRFIEPTGTLSADKYRFVVDIECEYAKSIG